jgi:hypothetical protein
MENHDYTAEQFFAAALIMADEPLPLTLIAKLLEQGVILNEFIDAHSTLN